MAILSINGCSCSNEDDATNYREELKKLNTNVNEFRNATIDATKSIKKNEE